MDALTLPASTNQTDRSYATLGRALSLASSFEADCRLIVFALQLKAPYTASDDMQAFTELDKVLDNWLSRNQEIFITELGVPDKYKEFLVTAREARNYIAHEAGDDFDSILQEKDRWKSWCQALREKVFHIAVGKQIVAILLARVTNGIMPTASAMSAYPENAVQWVLSEHENSNH